MSGTLRLKPFLLALALPLAVGWLSMLLGGDMQETYNQLVQPSFAPPAWVFGVVWPILYLMMGIASYLIFVLPEDASFTRTQALTFYAVQLLLNLLWTPLFFGLELFSFAFWELCALLVVAIITTALFGILRKSAFWLMMPYLVWLVYAAALNRAIATLN